MDDDVDFSYLPPGANPLKLLILTSIKEFIESHRATYVKHLTKDGLSKKEATEDWNVVLDFLDIYIKEAVGNPDVSSDTHWEILRGFVREMLDPIAVVMLAKGVDVVDANAIVNRLGFAMDNPLNNPFNPTNVAPFEHRLELLDFKDFSELLRDNRKVFLDLLTKPPNDWSHREAELEWKWLITHLNRLPDNQPAE